MSVVGNRKQETKINVMGDLAHRLFPEHEARVYKGCFRRGVAEALQAHGLTDWSALAAQPVPARERFFREVLTRSEKCLQGIGLKPGQVAGLSRSLILENKKFLAR